MCDESKDVRREGRDEMNLCEHPITLLTERCPQGVKTLVFEGKHGTLTVSGSDAHGLPAAPDADVIVGLLELTKWRNDFTNPKVGFSRYELLKLLGWPDETRYYRRLNESLNRWVGVTLYYDGCWWDKVAECWCDAKIHILNSVLIYDEERRRKLRVLQSPLPYSSFTWGKEFFESCQAGNLKRLDLDTYFSLKSAVSKQLYRFLDKRFYHRGEWTFDLHDLAFERVGLSRSYAVGDIKRKLNRSFEELEGIRFLEKLSPADRYGKTGRGQWNVRVVHKLPALTEAKPAPEPTTLERELIDLGVTPSQAVELARDFQEDRIREQIENLDGRRRKVKDPGAWLASAIRKGYAVKAKPAATQIEPVVVPVVDQAKRDRVQAAREHWEGLTAEERKRIDAEALAHAAPETRADFEAERVPVVRRMKLAAIRNAFLDATIVAE